MHFRSCVETIDKFYFVTRLYFTCKQPVCELKSTRSISGGSLYILFSRKPLRVGVGGGVLDFGVSQHSSEESGITQQLYIRAAKKCTFSDSSLYFLSENVNFKSVGSGGSGFIRAQAP